MPSVTLSNTRVATLYNAPMNPGFSSVIKNFSVCLLAPLLCTLVSGVALARDVQSAADYRLGTGDVIEVRVYGEDDLSMRLSVPADGRVDYAFVGELQVEGRTVNSVQQEIYQRLLGDYLVEPRVSVSMASYRNFYVYGEVARPGGYAWEPGLTVRKVITLAGGLRERASGSKWYLVPENSNENERRKVSEDDRIQAGDTLTIEQSFF